MLTVFRAVSIVAISVAALPVLAACGASNEPAIATHLGFYQEPSFSAAAAQSLGTVRVVLLSTHEHIVVGVAAAVQLSLVSTNGAHLRGTLSADVLNGVATFPDLNVDSAGIGYRIVAKATGLDSAVSLPFNVTLGPPAQLRFDSIQYARAGLVLPPVTVRVLDAGGNFLPTANTVITVGSHWTAVGGTTTRGALNGKAVFDDLVLTKWGADNWLYAAAPNVDSATSNFFMVWPGPCTQLAVSQIAGGHVGTSLGSIYVSRGDSYGNTCVALPPGGSATYTIALGNNPSGAALSGPTTAIGFYCCYVFNSIVIDKPGTGYTLIVQSNGLSATTNRFDIAP